MLMAQEQRRQHDCDEACALNLAGANEETPHDIPGRSVTLGRSSGQNNKTTPNICLLGARAFRGACLLAPWRR